MKDEKCFYCEGKGELVAVIGDGQPTPENTILIFCRCDKGKRMAEDQVEALIKAMS